jgi:hypothetical protein
MLRKSKKYLKFLIPLTGARVKQDVAAAASFFYGANGAG